jgi:hypothetical protein
VNQNIYIFGVRLVAQRNYKTCGISFYGQPKGPWLLWYRGYMDERQWDGTNNTKLLRYGIEVLDVVQGSKAHIWFYDDFHYTPQSFGMLRLDSFVYSIKHDRPIEDVFSRPFPWLSEYDSTIPQQTLVAPLGWLASVCSIQDGQTYEQRVETSAFQGYTIPTIHRAFQGLHWGEYHVLAKRSYEVVFLCSSIGTEGAVEETRKCSEPLRRSDARECDGGLHISATSTSMIANYNEAIHIDHHCAGYAFATSCIICTYWRTL